MCAQMNNPNLQKADAWFDRAERLDPGGRVPLLRVLIGAVCWARARHYTDKGYGRRR